MMRTLKTFSVSDWDANERGWLCVLQVWLLHQVRSGNPEGPMMIKNLSQSRRCTPTLTSRLHNFKHGALNFEI